MYRVLYGYSSASSDGSVPARMGSRYSLRAPVLSAVAMCVIKKVMGKHEIRRLIGASRRMLTIKRHKVTGLAVPSLFNSNNFVCYMSDMNMQCFQGKHSHYCGSEHSRCPLTDGCYTCSHTVPGLSTRSNIRKYVNACDTVVINNLAWPCTEDAAVLRDCYSVRSQEKLVKS